MIGTRLAHYEITSHLGTGGMGEVYQATDSRLGRKVAIKLLPEAFTHDAERAARFDREARVLASLNHPNIAAIHGLEEASGRKFLVMELAQGETLAQRISRSAVPVDESLAIAKQICEALEAAHEKGVIHRDLKPANIKVAPDGMVKVLDFGLAKAYALEPSNVDMSNSPTLSMAATNVGVILGTAAYMSPEQARGKVVDRRTDIFALGCVLYEMLTASQVFRGEDIPDIVSRVLQREPDWTLLPANLPSVISKLLRLCLQKDARNRRQTATDVKIDIADAAAQTPPEIGDGYSRIGGLTLTIVPPSGTFLHAVGNLSSAPEISPDGTAVMYVAPGGIYVRRLDSLEPQRVQGSEAAMNAAFWSPDSTTVVLPCSPGRLIKVHLPDGPGQVITQGFGPSRGGTWSDKGTILIAYGDLFAVPASGGELKQVEMPGTRAGVYLNPEFLAGSEDFLFLFVPKESPEEGEVYLATLRDGKAFEVTLLLSNRTAAHHTLAGGGRILFVRNDNLFAQKLNRSARRLEGEAELIAKNVASQPSMTVNRGEFSVARNGAVAWRPGKAALSQVTVFDRQGNLIETTGPPGSFDNLVLSPSETQVLVSSFYRSWLLDAGQSGRLALNAGAMWFGWSPDGTRLIGLSKSGAFVEMSAGGSGQMSELDHSGSVGRNLSINDISPDGKCVLAQAGGGKGIFAIQLQGKVEETSPRALIQTGEAVFSPRFSPDGLWIVYEAGDSDLWSSGLYIQPFPGPGQRRQIAPTGRLPVWRKDGKEILYVASDTMMSIEVETSGSNLRFSAPTRLFSGLRSPAGSVAISRPLDVSGDGSRIYWTQAVDQPDSNMIHVKMGWMKDQMKK